MHLTFSSTTNKGCANNSVKLGLIQQSLVSFGLRELILVCETSLFVFQIAQYINAESQKARIVLNEAPANLTIIYQNNSI